MNELNDASKVAKDFKLNMKGMPDEVNEVMVTSEIRIVTHE